MLIVHSVIGKKNRRADTQYPGNLLDFRRPRVLHSAGLKTSDKPCVDPCGSGERALGIALLAPYLGKLLWKKHFVISLLGIHSIRATAVIVKHLAKERQRTRG